MSTYKVIQDIEAEDKLLGPLTLRQFVYAAIVFVSGFIAFKLFVAHLWYIAMIFVPQIVFFGMLAAPFGHDQSNEVWLLAKIRFALKPRRRIWDQSGIKELVTITVPKKIEKFYTNGLNQDEVKSRLTALASTIDSRGWAVKNVSVNVFSQPVYASVMNDSDRLVDMDSIPQPVPDYDTNGVSDILDVHTSSTAQHLDALITASAQQHRQQVVQQMQQTAAPATDYPFMPSEPSQSPPEPKQGFAEPTASVATPPVRTASNNDEQALLDRIHAEQAREDENYEHMHTIKPLTNQPQTSVADSQKAGGQQDNGTTTTPVDPAILELAHNDDLNVATLARQANKTLGQLPKDEVVVSLR